MAQVIVRNLDEEVVETLRQRAKRKERSLEHELRDILTNAARPSKDELLAEAEEIAAMTPPGPRVLAEDLIREDRDSR